MKKFIALALVLTCVLSMVGCSSNQEQLKDENGVIVACVSTADSDNITISIADAGNTNYDIGSSHTIPMSEKFPALTEGDYIRLVYNPSAAVSQVEISHIEEILVLTGADRGKAILLANGHSQDIIDSIPIEVLEKIALSADGFQIDSNMTNKIVFDGQELKPEVFDPSTITVLDENGNVVYDPNTQTSSDETKSTD